MANIYNYINIPHDTYDNWKSNTVGNTYLVNINKPFCWNYITELWYNAGFPTGYPLMTVSNFPAEIWIVYKDANASYNGTNYFSLIYTKEQIKKGDVIVISGTGNYSDIAIANEDYNSNHPYSINVIIQGYQGVNTASILTNFPLNYFVGAFRYNEWNTTPPTPTPTSRKRFPWVLYANKLRNKY